MHHLSHAWGPSGQCREMPTTEGRSLDGNGYGKRTQQMGRQVINRQLTELKGFGVSPRLNSGEVSTPDEVKAGRDRCGGGGERCGRQGVRARRAWGRVYRSRPYMAFTVAGQRRSGQWQLAAGAAHSQLPVHTTRNNISTRSRMRDALVSLHTDWSAAPRLAIGAIAVHRCSSLRTDTPTQQPQLPQPHTKPTSIPTPEASTAPPHAPHLLRIRRRCRRIQLDELTVHRSHDDARGGGE